MVDPSLGTFHKSLSQETIAKATAFIWGVLAIIFALAVYVDCTLTLQNLRRDAVRLGYAEWYSDEEGGEPTSWRWKEQNGE